MVMENYPAGLNKSLSGEKPEFAVKALRHHPLKGSLYVLGFGVFWTLFTMIFVFAFLIPILTGEDVDVTVNGEEVSTAGGFSAEVIAPAAAIILFVIIGLAVSAGGIYMMLAEGGWFVGTSKRLVMFRKDMVRSIDWEQFNGDIIVKGDDAKADITLKMRTGTVHRQKDGRELYTPDTVNMCGIRGVSGVEEVCRKRIKENDPTPVDVSS
jgi:hypothetical protein